MKLDSNKSKLRRRQPVPAVSAGNSTRGTILIVVLLVVIGALFVGLKRFTARKGSTDSERGQPALLEKETGKATPEDPMAATKRSWATEPTRVHPGASNLAIAPGSRTVAVPNELSAQAQQWVTNLTQIELRDGSLTREQANQWKQNLQQLVQRGVAAVPAIAEFLKRNVDMDFRSIPGGNSLGYGSLRLALFDSLEKIGGMEAIAVTRDTLKTTADPLEVALLSRSLEHQAPGQYREEELIAARETLAQAMNGKLADREIAPVFELLQAYGDQRVVSDLAAAVSRWNYYATFALAGLRDGAGIPTLIELAEDAKIGAMAKGDLALLPLAQVATQYPLAATALVEQARSNAIPESAWASVAKALAGVPSQYGKGIFGKTATEVTLTNDEINKRLTLIDQILAANANSDAARLLDQARAKLTATRK